MKVPMGPPPPKNPILMGPPPAKNPNPTGPPPSKIPNPSPEPAAGGQTVEEDAQVVDQNGASADETTQNPNPKPNPSPDPEPSSTSSGNKDPGIAIPYTIPPWSQPSGQPFFLEVLKDGVIIEQLDV